jgi:hypothetical protein
MQVGDSSALVKIYADEPGHERVRSLPTVVISQLARVEVPAALWRKHWMGELTAEQAGVLVAEFEADHDGTVERPERFVVVPVSGVILDVAARLTGSMACVLTTPSSRRQPNWSRRRTRTAAHSRRSTRHCVPPRWGKASRYCRPGDGSLRGRQPVSRKARHAHAGNVMAGPVGFLESRTATTSGANATSTQAVFSP